MKLWLDDDPLRDSWVPDGDWVIVRTVNDAKFEILASEVWEAASLDNDLGLDAPGGDGRKLVDWMEQHNIWPTGYCRVHSMNPVERMAMEKVIKRHYEEGR